MNRGFWDSTFLFIGPAHSGKSTLATLLRQEVVMQNKDSSFVRVFRRDEEIVKYGDMLLPIPKMVKCTLQSEEKVPRFVVNTLLGNFSTQILRQDCSIFDGYPLEKEEAIFLHEILSYSEKTKGKILVFNLLVSGEEVLSRIDASNKRTMRERVRLSNLEWFDGVRSQMIRFYKNNDCYTVVDIDASRPLPYVFADVMDAARKHFEIV